MAIERNALLLEPLHVRRRYLRRLGERHGAPPVRVADEQEDIRRACGFGLAGSARGQEEGEQCQDCIFGKHEACIVEQPSAEPPTGPPAVYYAGSSPDSPCGRAP